MRTKRSNLAQRVCAAVLGIAAAVVLPLALGACNTVEGVGEDVEATGQAIDEAVENDP